LKYGAPRPDLISDLGAHAPTDCGFSGSLALAEFPVGRRTLLIRVMDARGNFRDFCRTIVISEPTPEASASATAVADDAAAEPVGFSSLIAFPQQVSVRRLVGSTEITWDTGDGSQGEVYISVNGEPETLFSSGPRGSKQSCWILVGSTYAFRLYAGTVYNRARLFVAPTRFSAGIPLKICEAAAHGLPTVATSLAGRQLGWEHERELLLADDPRSFANACTQLYTDPSLWNQLRANVLKRVGADFSPNAFSDQLKTIIG